MTAVHMSVSLSTVKRCVRSLKDKGLLSNGMVKNDPGQHAIKEMGACNLGIGPCGQTTGRGA